MLSQLQTAAGVSAAAGVSESDLSDVSKQALFATAADNQEMAFQIAQAFQKAAFVAQDGLAMHALFTDPSKIDDLSICSLDAMLYAPGGLDTFLDYFNPVINDVNISNGIDLNSYLHQPQNPAPGFSPNPVAVAPESRFSWGGNAPTNTRAAFPAMPTPAAQSGGGSGLENFAPHERWKAIDQGLVG